MHVVAESLHIVATFDSESFSFSISDMLEHENTNKKSRD